MSVRLSCPYCNAAFTLAVLPPTRRAVCPRCSEAFAVKAADGEGEPAAPVTPAVAAPVNEPSPSRWPLVVALLGAVVVVVGVAVYFRWKLGPKPVPEPPLAPQLEAKPPAELAGLGFLPADCNVVFAVQPGPLLAYAARNNRDPLDILTQAGVPPGVFAALAAAGLPLAEIDHIAGGTQIGAVFRGRLAVVLVLRRPLADEAKFRHELKAKPDKTGKPRFTIEKPFAMSLARVSDTVWVFGFQDEDFGPAEAGGFGAGGPQLAADLRALVAGRVPTDAAVWLAAGPEQWDKSALVTILELTSDTGKKAAALLKQGRSAVVYLSFGEKPELGLAVQCVDAAVGERLRAYFRSKATSDAAAGGTGEWATFEAAVDPRTGVQLVRQFIDDARK